MFDLQDESDLETRIIDQVSLDFRRKFRKWSDLQVMRDELLSGSNIQEHHENRKRLWMRQLPVLAGN